MHILRTRCVPILTYGAGVWTCKNEQLRKIGVLFSKAVRKEFGYKRFESAQSILRVFVFYLWICILIVCFFIVVLFFD